MTTPNDTALEPVAMEARAELDRERPTVERSAIGLLRSQAATVRQAFVGAVLAEGDVSLSQGGSRTLIAAGNLRVDQGGGGMLLAGGDVEITQGGSGTLVALGGVRLQQGGAMVALARDVQVAEGSTVGLALTPRLTVQAGGRVVVGPAQAALAGVVGGAVAGAIVLGVSRLLRR